MTMRVGELRPNQLLHTYGVGAVADLPNLSIVVMGLDFWDLSRSAPLTEDRLLAAVRRKLGAQVEGLRTPPYVPETRDVFADWTRVGVPVGAFPRWLRCSDGRCNRLAPIETGLFELLPSAYSPDKVRYVHSCRGSGGRRPTAVPARFVLACTSEGHLDDFPWLYYVHRGTTPDSGDHTLQLVERGTTGEAANVFVVCSCDASRSMSEAIGEAGERNLPACRGRHAHLGSFEPCGLPARTLALGATNGWFAMQMRVFSLPQADGDIDQLVAEYWDTLDLLVTLPDANAREFLPRLRCWSELEIYGVEAVLAAVRRHADANDEGEETDDLDLAGPEWEAFTHEEDVERVDFVTQSVGTPAAARRWLDRVVLVPRLREVSALYGFTRVDAPEWDVLSTDDRHRAPLSREDPAWVPCAEMRGEGIFMRFQEDRLAEWESRSDVREREKILREAHDTWRTARRLEPGSWPGIRYLLLHTFSHMLIREFALESGYGAAGIGERIYAWAGERPMAGILLYTAAPDSEGTLGGLVSLGQPDRLGALVRQALQAATLCSSDPLCAEHDPREHGQLYGAACHVCLFASETSCERGNHYLDRALVADTLADLKIGFFT